MAFAGLWDVSDAVELRPSIRSRVICPDVVEPLYAISAAKSTDLLAITVAMEEAE